MLTSSIGCNLFLASWTICDIAWCLAGQLSPGQNVSHIPPFTGANTDLPLSLCLWASKTIVDKMRAKIFECELLQVGSALGQFFRFRNIPLSSRCRGNASWWDAGWWNSVGLRYFHSVAKYIFKSRHHVLSSRIWNWIFFRNYCCVPTVRIFFSPNTAAHCKYVPLHATHINLGLNISSQRQCCGSTFDMSVVQVHSSTT